MLILAMSPVNTPNGADAGSSTRRENLLAQLNKAGIKLSGIVVVTDIFYYTLVYLAWQIF